MLSTLGIPVNSQFPSRFRFSISFWHLAAIKGHHDLSKIAGRKEMTLLEIKIRDIVTPWYTTMNDGP